MSKRRRSRPVNARLCAAICPSLDRGGLAEHRERLLSGLAGRVIEVGAGSGMNFAKYPPEVTSLVAMEPESYLCEYMRRSAQEASVEVQVVEGVAERLPFESASFDAAVVSLMLCSVSDPRQVLDELFRVVRPGGRLHFLEHVRSGSAVLRSIQKGLDATFWPPLFGNCHTYRDTAATIREAGFGVERLEELRFPDMRVALPTSPHILGVASRPAA
jgi:ubiquinone/menaquinone biosynthesis C-methylase UbiE